MKPRAIYIGWDPRERDAFAVARASIQRHLSAPIPIHALMLDDLVARGLYTRPTERRDGRVYDLLSVRSDYDGACSTEFAISRFFTKHLAREGLALFLDCDMLARTDIAEVFDHCERVDPGKAVYCVKHDHRPANALKMDAQAQSVYARKNWSSFMVIDCDHVANGALTLAYLNAVPGRDLHAFRWLADCDIGALDMRWNWLVGHSPPLPAVVHFTEGTPAMAGYENVPFADEWRAERASR